MNTPTNTKTVADITIILCCVLFLILLIAGIAFVNVFAIAFSFIIGGIGYAMEDYYGVIKEHYETIEKR